MKRRYDRHGIQLWEGDVFQIAPRLDDDMDVVITDPPYNVGVAYGAAVNDAMGDDQYLSWCARWFYLLRYKARAVCITPGTTNVAVWCHISPPDWLIAWHKPAAMGNSPFGVCNWEPILFWGKPNRNSGTDVIHAPIVPDPYLKWHPCPKPVQWATRQIQLVARPQDTILDPFAGAGTTLIAAKRLGIRAIGIEINPTFCDRICERLDNDMPLLEVAQPGGQHWEGWEA